MARPAAARLTMTALAVSIVASIASYVGFVVKGEPFGTINDFGNGVIGAGSGVLAWQVRRRGSERTGPPPAATAAGVAGAAVAIGGSALVISKLTGFLLAGFVSSIGFALVGVWLTEYNRSLRMRPDVSRRISTVGMATGAIMALGFIDLPAALLRYDDFNAAPAWTWLGFAAWLGTYVLLPAWCFTAVRSLQLSRRV
jgi:hypothetical protein